MADTSLVMELLHKLSSKNPTLTQVGLLCALGSMHSLCLCDLAVL